MYNGQTDYSVHGHSPLPLLVSPSDCFEILLVQSMISFSRDRGINGAGVDDNCDKCMHIHVHTYDGIAHATLV